MVNHRTDSERRGHDGAHPLYDRNSSSSSAHLEICSTAREPGGADHQHSKTGEKHLVRGLTKFIQESSKQSGRVSSDFSVRRLFDESRSVF